MTLYSLLVKRLPSFFIALVLCSGLGGEPFEEGPARRGDAGARPYDVVIYGATPGGIACAVRAAREGLGVLLVHHLPHVGGMMTSGLSIMDTLYSGARAPLYDELRGAIYEHYRTLYGEDSPQYAATLPGRAKTRYEAHVAEGLIEELLAGERRLRVVREHYPRAVRRQGRTLHAVTFSHMREGHSFTARAGTFLDCSYEGDLAATAGVRYRVGREARAEFDEEHAGVIYVRRAEWPPKGVDPDYLARYRRLNLVHYDTWDEVIHSASSGAAHPAVQAFNMRTVLTDDPDNRILPDKPPGYDPEDLRRTFDLEKYRPPTGFKVPNRKHCWNHPEVVGAQTAYVDGSWETRRDVLETHRRATLSLLYYFQNDPSVPEASRRAWRELGLPRDEFPDNGHMPYEVYVREARRIVGRATFTEHDARLAPEFERARVHATSITATEWFMDSHACTPRRVPGSLQEGEVHLKNKTFPGQVSYACLLPREIDNLLVPVCLSSTHIGWGTIRLEPTWMSLGEAAAHAAALARRKGVVPARIDPDELVRILAERRFLISFFNDIEGQHESPWYPAVQYLGTRGFFGSYDARPSAPLRQHLGAIWASHAARWLAGANVDPSVEARAAWRAEERGGAELSAGRFAADLETAFAGEGVKVDALREVVSELTPGAEETIRRGEAARWIYELSKRLAAPR